LGQVQGSRFYTGRQIRKNGEDKKKLAGILRIPGPNIRRPKTVARGKGKVAASILLAENGTEKLQVILSNTGTNADVVQTINVEDIVAVAHSQVEMGRKCGKNVPAQAISVWDIRIGKKRTGLPKTRWVDTFKRVVAGQ
jgi:hypothetical protein